MMKQPTEGGRYIHNPEKDELIRLDDAKASSADATPSSAAGEDQGDLSIDAAADTIPAAPAPQPRKGR